MHVADSCFRHLGICDKCIFSFPFYTLTLLVCFIVYSSRIVFSAVSLSGRDICVASRYPGIRYIGVKAALCRSKTDWNSPKKYRLLHELRAVVAQKLGFYANDFL